MTDCDDYVCTLSEVDLKKAKDELGEDPKQRLGAVETLRQWVLQQPHLRSPTDTAFLLRFLRIAKFSQLKARSILDGFLTSMTENKEWFHLPENDTKVEFIYGEGVMVLLPGTDRQGRRVVFLRQGMMDATWTKYSYDELVRSNMTFMENLLWDESVQVNGIVFVSDLTGFSLKHQTSITPSMMRRSASIMQGKFPMRFKGLHYYNCGPFFEALFTIFKLMMSKKLQDRMVIHDTMEHVYRHIPMEILPSDFLPDDYEGKHAGTMADLIEKNRKLMTSSEVQARIHKYMSQAYGADESKRLKDEPQASFRKLNVE